MIETEQSTVPSSTDLGIGPNVAIKEIDQQLEVARQKPGHRIAKFVVKLLNGEDSGTVGASEEVIRLEAKKKRLEMGIPESSIKFDEPDDLPPPPPAEW